MQQRLRALAFARDALRDDPLTLCHGARVAALAELLGGRVRRVRLSGDYLWIAGLLHDLGKARFAHIARLPRALTRDEMLEMARHPVVSEEMARPHFGAQVASYIRHHHESFDGTGYPDGLAGNAIPVGARILAVADAFDAMVSPRPYRPALTLLEALAELSRLRGTRFDPHLVSSLRELVLEEPVDPDEHPCAQVLARYRSLGFAWLGLDDEPRYLRSPRS